MRQIRLISADEALADLQQRCGGRMPGTLAVPELLALVRQGRCMGLRIAREFAAFDGEAQVSGFVRIHPLGEAGGGGCELLIENWQRSAASPSQGREFAERLDAIDRATAEVSARLDARQRVQVLSALASDAAQSANGSDGGTGRGMERSCRSLRESLISNRCTGGCSMAQPANLPDRSVTGVCG